ncbi:hypothetical protein D3C80_1494140 [compost metagenome]
MNAGTGVRRGTLPDDLTGGVKNLKLDVGRIGRQFIAPRRLAVGGLGRVPDSGGVLADIVRGLGQAVALLAVQQGGQQLVGQQLLLDAGHLCQLARELIGVHRRQGILVLQLGGQQREEGLEVRRQHGRAGVDLVGGGVGRDGGDHRSDLHIDAVRRQREGGPGAGRGQGDVGLDGETGGAREGAAIGGAVKSAAAAEAG